MVLQTQYASVDIRCPHCRVTWEVPVARYVNVGTDPDARLGILLGTMHRSRCPGCKREQAVDFIFDYYDPEQGLVVQVRPEWEIRAGGGEDWYWQRYEDLVHAYASHDVRVDVVFGFQEMIDKYLGGAEAVAAAKREWEARKANPQPASEPDAPPEEPVGDSGRLNTKGTQS